MPPSSAGSSRAPSVPGQVAAQAVAEVKEPVAAELLIPFTRALVAVVDSQRPLGSRAVDECEAVGRQAALDGVGLSSLVDAFLSASRILWARSVDPSGGSRARTREDLLVTGEAVFRAADVALAAVARGFGMARRSIVRQQESERREFIDDLLSGSADTGAVMSRGARFGLQLMGPHTVAVAVASDSFRDDPRIVVDLDTRLRTSLPRRDMLVATKDGRLVLVVGERAGRERPLAENARLLATVLREIQRRVQDASSVRLSVGPAMEGPAGTAESYRVARQGAELALKLGWSEPLVRPPQVAVYDVLLRDRQALIGLVTSVLSPLTSARGGAGPLVATLLSYLACGAVATETARAMNLSVRAVTYRLSRIARLTGWDPTNPAHWLTLHTAAEGARLLGWPEEPI